MTADFVLDPRLSAGSDPVVEWPLSHVRLKADRRFPWLLVVPRRPGIVEITDLEAADYMQLCGEIRAATRMLVALARPGKTNVATLGNSVAQLHVHIIGRWPGDAAWPGPVWCIPEGAPPAEAEHMAKLVRYRDAAPGFTPGDGG